MSIMNERFTKQLDVLSSHLLKTNNSVSHRPHNVPEYISKREAPAPIQKMVPHKYVDMSKFKNYLTADKMKIWRINSYSQETKFSNKSNQYDLICITDAWDLSNGDVMIAIRYVYDYKSYYENIDKYNLVYLKLSEIRLSYYPEDRENL